MSHFHDQYFEAQVNAASADDDNLCAYLRQKAADEQQEAEYAALCDADEAAHDWLGKGYFDSPQEAEVFFNTAAAEVKANTARLEELIARLNEMSNQTTDLIEKAKDLLTSKSVAA